MENPPSPTRPRCCGAAGGRWPLDHWLVNVE